VTPALLLHELENSLYMLLLCSKFFPLKSRNTSPLGAGDAPEDPVIKDGTDALRVVIYHF